MGSITGRQPHVVCLGAPKYAGEAYLASFSQTFRFSILAAADRAETIAGLPALIARSGPIDAFVVRMGTPPYEPFDEALLAALAPACRIITSASAGFNEFDVDWMGRQGILFCNSVDAVAEATADMAVFLLLATLRNTSRAERSARAGRWRGGPAGGLVPARDPAGLTLGIVGMGAIGKHLARKAAVFGLKIRYYNRRQLPASQEEAYKAAYCGSLHELLASSDVVSLNCPLNEETTNLISTAEFDAMRDGAFLINTARGAVVDEAALKVALTTGKVARAGLDVLCNEPNVDPWFFEQENVILQPHLGGLTDVAYQKAERECFENIRAYFETGKANSPVNADRLEKR
ncbi:ankyrin repeat containing protein [Botryosphaeria dothidea]|uniref:Ankyrin repeat containing protein n=1 Tax=Botryosphaeria dothidea TaxID=55169 RepID=A0A8H4MYI0_9PEZI|nr:ankyrin repeat containing protein [Botryosphaeria dothidea]